MFEELREALILLEKEKGISRYAIMDGIENSLLSACKSYYGSTDNVSVTMDRETCEYHVYVQKEVVEEVYDPNIEISLEDAQSIDPTLRLGDMYSTEIFSKDFSRVASQNAKNVIQQKIREEERNILFEQYSALSHGIVTGIVQRFSNKNVVVMVNKIEAILAESEQIKGESYHPQDRLKLYVLDVKATNRGPKITVSRTHPELVRHLFEQEVSEVRDGIVEIKSIAREAGNRTKIAVWSNDPDVDAVGACVGQNGNRINAIVDELSGEKIDVVNWDESAAYFIQNALSPAKVIAVSADEDEKSADVIVPDYQLSLAIGKEGQNARLAARLTNYKIDIKSETQARESGELPDGYYGEEEYYDEEADDTVSEE